MTSCWCRSKPKGLNPAPWMPHVCAALQWPAISIVLAAGAQPVHQHHHHAVTQKRFMPWRAQVAVYSMRPGLMKTLRARDAGLLFWSCGMLQLRPNQGRFCLQAAHAVMHKTGELEPKVQLDRCCSPWPLAAGIQRLCRFIDTGPPAVPVLLGSAPPDMRSVQRCAQILQGCSYMSDWQGLLANGSSRSLTCSALCTQHCAQIIWGCSRMSGWQDGDRRVRVFPPLPDGFLDAVLGRLQGRLHELSIEYLRMARSLPPSIVSLCLALLRGIHEKRCAPCHASIPLDLHRTASWHCRL